MQTLNDPPVIANFKDESVVVIGKIEIDIDPSANSGEGDYQILPDVIDFGIDTNIEDEVSRFSTYSFLITCLNTDNRYFSWFTKSPKYGWLKQGRRIKIYAGIKVNSIDYYYQWIIGRVDSYELSTIAGEEICTIEGRDFMRTVLDYKLYSPNTHWGTEIVFSTVALQADYPMPGYWDMDAVSYDDKSFDVSDEDDIPLGLFFKPDGSKVYMIGGRNEKIHQYSLSKNWDISTATYDSKFLDVSEEEASPADLFFKSDGNEVYIVGGTADTIFQYTLETSWDISTAAYAPGNKNVDVSGQDNTPNGLFLKPDGSKVYIMGYQHNIIYQYTLGTPWDISTATYDTKNFDISSQDTEPSNLFFQSDGGKVYIHGYDNIKIFQYTLSTAWDISTANYNDKSFDLSGEDIELYGIFFKPEGNKMYVVGAVNDMIYQYSITGCTGIYIAYLDSLTKNGEHLSPVYKNLDFGYVESISLFSFYADKIPSYSGTDNLVVYYFTSKSIESVVGDILYYAGIFATTGDRDTWLAETSYVTPTGKKIDRVWFNTGMSAFEAIRLLAEVAQYRFYFDYLGKPVFKPRVSIGTSVDTFSGNCIEEEISSENIEEVYNHIIVIGEKRETLG